MGSCCSRSCRCPDCCCCYCRCPKPIRVDKSSQENRESIVKKLRTAATSPIQMILRNKATSPIAGPPITPPQPRLLSGINIAVIKKNQINTAPLNKIADDANFADIVNEDISLDIHPTEESQKRTLKPSSPTPKPLSDSSSWKDKYFVHGLLSDIIADVGVETHACISSAISSDIDKNFGIFHDINARTAAIHRDRDAKISVKEQSIIKQFIFARDELIKEVLSEGRSYANQYEEHYRKLIEKFIRSLETEMSKHLDELQKGIEADRQAVFLKSKTSIQIVTDKAVSARNDLHRRVQEAAAKKRKEIMETIDNIFEDKTNQPLGYEQLRKLDINVYSTVGAKKKGEGCGFIGADIRKKFLDDIENDKLSQAQIKRTTYIESKKT